jgi:membrane protein DedA with SNARE-associated domain
LILPAVVCLENLVLVGIPIPATILVGAQAFLVDGRPTVFSPDLDGPGDGTQFGLLAD